jgi:AraC-like DNA-binding protein
MFDKLHNGVMIIDNTVANLNNANMSTSEDSRFRFFKYDPLSMDANPYLLTEMQRSFKNLLLQNSLVADVGILFSREVVITRQRLFYNTDFYTHYGQFLRCGDLSYEEWIDVLSRQKLFIPAQWYQSADYGEYEAITYVARWFNTEFPRENIFFATFPVNAILPLIADEEALDLSRIRIYDMRGNILLERNQKKEGKYHLLTDQSLNNSLRFEIDISDSLINKKMRPVRNLILVFVLITAVIIISLVLLFAYKSSRPMVRFITSIDGTKNIQFEYASHKKENIHSFFSNIYQVYSDLAESIIKVDKKLENSLQTIEWQTQLLRTQIFDMAIQRGIYAPKDLTEFQAIFPDFPRLFQLAAIRYESPEGLAFKEILALQLNLINAVKNQIRDIYIHGINGNLIVLLLPLSSQDDSWHLRLQNLRSGLNRQIDMTLSFSLSDIFGKTSELPRAWQQLQFIHMLPGIDRLTTVEEMKDISAHNVRIPVNITTLEMIYDALRSANYSIVNTIMQECIDLLPRPEDPLISGLTYNMLSNMIMQLKLENPSTLIDIDIPVYAGGSQDDLFRKQIPECFLKICDNIQRHKKNSITQFGQEILDYISDHIFDHELYIAMVSDRFNISPPTLQKLIKNTSGHTFSMYVEEQRLKKAYGMILEGGHTLLETAACCGFSNTNSFYKAFKRKYGISPGKILDNPSRVFIP